MKSEPVKGSGNGTDQPITPSSSPKTVTSARGGTEGSNSAPPRTGVNSHVNKTVKDQPEAAPGDPWKSADAEGLSVETSLSWNEGTEEVRCQQLVVEWNSHSCNV